MVNMGLLPTETDDQDSCVSSLFLTFVVPAPQGCNLKCPFCIIKQRREISQTHLRPIDFVRFFYEVARSTRIFAVAIQGYEPLLPESREYTQAILETSRSLGVPAALVTNGVLLRNSVEWVAPLAPTKIAISLDAGIAEAHDQIRGVVGAWVSTVSGIRHAIEALSPLTNIAVASVLTSNRAPLDSMPLLLNDIGVTDWIISPLQRIGINHIGGPSDAPERLYRNLVTLQEAAERANIRLTIDDELDRLPHMLAIVEKSELRRLRIRTLPKNVELVRLVPSGQCSVNADILRRVTSVTPRWRPGKIDAGDFVERLARRSAEPTYSDAA